MARSQETNMSEKKPQTMTTVESDSLPGSAHGPEHSSQEPNVVGTEPDTESIQEAGRRSLPAMEKTESIRRTASNVLNHISSRITTRTWPEPPPPPDGGLKAWTQVAMGWLVVFTTWGYVNSFGAFQTYYTATLPYPASAISWIGSVQIWCTLVIGPFSGRMLDAGLFLPTFLVGAILQILGMFMMSLSTQYWQLMLTQGILTGVGGGIFFTPALALVTTYFSKNRGIAIGIVTTSNSIGGIIYPLVVRQLIPVLGFAWTARVIAFITTACLCVVLTFMRPRLPPRKSGPVIDVTAFKEPVYVALCVGLFGVMWANYYTFYYIVSFGVESLGLSYSSASILLIVLNGAGTPFRILFPFIADRVGPLNVATPIVFVWFITAFCWMGVRNVGSYYAFAAFYGVFTGGFQAMIAFLVASITKRLDTVGTRLGMLFSIVSFAALTGPPIGGALQSANNGAFTAPQAWAAAATCIGFLGLATARFLKAGLDLKAWC